MSLFEVMGLLITLAAVFSWFNHLFIGLPTTIGVMVLALLFSFAILVLGSTAFPALGEWARDLLDRIDFSSTILEGMLSFLLFAGALFVDMRALAQGRYVIGLLASVGVVFSAFAVAGMAWLVFSAMGVSIPLAWCLVFGALISPTDPIAVLGILKSAGVPKSLETKIVGESLFNDGVALVLFIVLLGMATSGEASLASAGKLFLLEAGGGAVLGFVLAWVAHRMLARIDHSQVEILITLAVVTGGYSLALALHFSGPIAMVVAGLFLGNHRNETAMSEGSRLELNHFWELLDELLNAVLFVLIGFEVLVMSFDAGPWIAGALMVPLVLLARFVTVSIPVLALGPFREFSRGAIPVLTWGGLRGGISVALVLSLPAGEVRDVLVTVTYVIVLFSLLVQGLTVGRLARRLAQTGSK